MNVKIRAAASALVAVGLLIAGCQKPQAPKSADVPTRSVRVAEVGTGDVVDAAELVGELQGIEEVRVFAQVPERIRTLAVKEGQTVKEGELLAVINADLQSEVVNQAQAGLEAAIANRDAVQDNLRRVRQLVQAGSAPKSQLEALESQARAADAQVRQATAGLGSASAQKSRAILRAPIGGVVAQVNLKEGDLASPGVPVMTIVRDQRVKAVFRVPERDFLRVKEGMPVTLEPLADPSVKVEGKVTVRGPVVDRMTRTGLVEAHVDNADGRLVAGSSVRGTIELSRKPGVVLVPAEAVLMSADTERTGHAIAFVADGEVAKKRDVTVGVRQGGDIEVVQGLARGERLVVQGAHFLRDNNPIKATEARAAAKAKAAAAVAGEGK